MNHKKLKLYCEDCGNRLTLKNKKEKVYICRSCQNFVRKYRTGLAVN